jgi:hypothetical protein
MKALIFLIGVTLCLTVSAQVQGFWWWTWSSGNPPPGTNLGIAFSGWTDPTNAIQESASIKNRLPGQKFISLGGGNGNGSWDKNKLQAVTDAINEGRFSGYNGIAYDIEEGADGLAVPFNNSFAAARARGFKVLVTVSHSAPYGINDAAALMDYFFRSNQIDYLSPQLYVSGNEGSNDYSTSHGVQWNQFAASRAQIIPSIVSSNLYASAQSFFQGQGVKLSGYIQWKQN